MYARHDPRLINHVERIEFEANRNPAHTGYRALGEHCVGPTGGKRKLSKLNSLAVLNAIFPGSKTSASTACLPP